jgi:hypothetical protein
MNMLDGLKVTIKSSHRQGKQKGVVIQTQIVEKKYGPDLLVAVMTEYGYVHIRRFFEVDFHNTDIEQIINKPMEVISKVAQAEQSDSLKSRTQILDIRS